MPDDTAPEISLADLLTKPNGPLPSTRDALTHAEVADPKFLPFSQASDDELKKNLLRAIAGQFNSECSSFFATNKIPLSEVGRMIYVVARFMKG
jgi:hypothetical protein